jgi:hypothetical protein
MVKLMNALKLASIDRERIDALKKFIEEGGDELYYLNVWNRNMGIISGIWYQSK